MNANHSNQPGTTDVATSVTATECRLYEAECQLHAAHQSHVDAWIAAASEKLHEAIEQHLAAKQAANSGPYRVAS